MGGDGILQRGDRGREGVIAVNEEVVLRRQGDALCGAALETDGVIVGVCDIKIMGGGTGGIADGGDGFVECGGAYGAVEDREVLQAGAGIGGAEIGVADGDARTVEADEGEAAGEGERPGVRGAVGGPAMHEADVGKVVGVEIPGLAEQEMGVGGAFACGDEGGAAFGGGVEGFGGIRAVMGEDIAEIGEALGDEELFRGEGGGVGDAEKFFVAEEVVFLGDGQTLANDAEDFCELELVAGIFAGEVDGGGEAKVEEFADLVAGGFAELFAHLARGAVEFVGGKFKKGGGHAATRLREGTLGLRNLGAFCGRLCVGGFCLEGA